jgi:hypothetical protein
MKSVRSLMVLFAALVGAFALGAASGYAAKAPVAPIVVSRVVTSPCPAGMHVVVYYTAHTWACVDGASGS